MPSLRGAEGQDPSEAARALAARRQRVEKSCPVCDRPFLALKKQVYDTNDCAQRAAYLRSAEKRRAARRERYRRARLQTEGANGSLSMRVPPQENHPRGAEG